MDVTYYVALPFVMADNGLAPGEIGPELYRHACLMGLEGLVSKHRDPPYRAGRSRDWIKVKKPQAPGDEPGHRCPVMSDNCPSATAAAGFESEEYFLGTIVLANGDDNRLSIVDGQQRPLTVSIRSG